MASAPWGPKAQELASVLILTARKVAYSTLHRRCPTPHLRTHRVPCQPPLLELTEDNVSSEVPLGP